MKIIVTYNDGHAVCVVDDKYFHECDPLTKAKVINAFSSIEQDFQRDNVKKG